MKLDKGQYKTVKPKKGMKDFYSHVFVYFGSTNSISNKRMAKKS